MFIPQRRFLRQRLRSCNMNFINRNASYVYTSERSNLSSRSSYSTPDIEDSHARLELEVESEKELVTGKPGVERFSGLKATEMKLTTPAILIIMGCQVVVALSFSR